MNENKGWLARHKKIERLQMSTSGVICAGWFGFCAVLFYVLGLSVWSWGLQLVLMLGWFGIARLDYRTMCEREERQAAMRVLIAKLEELGEYHSESWE